MTAFNVLEAMVSSTPTTLWCDSCDPDEVAPSMEWGAIGATSNPPIILANTRAHRDTWGSRAAQIAAATQSATENGIAWQLVAEETISTASLLLPVFEATSGVDGRMAIQVDPNLHRDCDSMTRHAVHLSALAPNLIVKIPATSAGIAAIEEATFHGVTTLATVLYTVSQAVAAAEAVERGLRRREQEGLDTSDIHPKCAIMVGRLDDWLKAVAARDGVMVDPGCLEWAGVAVFKRAYQIFTERGYRSRLLSAAFRNHLHWSQFIGGAVTISPPFSWQRKYIASDIAMEDRMGNPVDSSTLDALYTHFTDFRRAYDPDGLMPEQYADFGPSARTLRQFLGALTDLELFVREAILPDPITVKEH